MKNIARKRTVEKIFAAVCKKYGITDRRPTKDDFFRICKEERILLPTDGEDVRILAEKISHIRGFCATSGGISMIYLRCLALKQRFDRFTAFHELGHFFMKHTQTFGGAVLLLNGETVENPATNLCEAEADYFSELATGLKRRGTK